MLLSTIADWLATLALERYEPAFIDAEIEFDDLPHLTDEDLKEVGLPVGPRRRLREAIKQLGNAPDLPAPEPMSRSVVAPHAVEFSATASGAERRHLTVMFVDLVGSTEMATKMDAEDVRADITRYQYAVAGIVTRHDGFVARYMGDGVLCYFGWPRANDDDAERAVRAGLEIVASVRALIGANGTALASRVGVATGVVIVGDLIGAGASEEAAAIGETPNLAARLQSLAKPNQLVVAPGTRALVRNVFELQSIPTPPLKGIAEPIQVYAVIGEIARESRFDARQLDVLTPIVGRERELELISECWQRVKTGGGQMVVVSGEAGIGKSRVTRAVIDAVNAGANVRMTYQCSPYHADSAFYPIIQHLTFATRIQPGDANEERLDKLERLAGINADNVALIAALLNIDSSARHAPLELSPAQVRAQTMHALVELLVAQSEEQPLLAVFEDLHWVDPTTLELLDLALDAIVDKKVLILATARPAFEHSFGGHPIVTRFALKRLGREQILSIVHKITSGKSVPNAVLEIITTRTDGVPLFVEELTKTILESGALKDGGDALVLDGPLDALAIPGTLHDSLMARLDRLQSIKEVAQMAACIGREFHHRLLASISTELESDLTAALEGLVAAELIYRRGLPPEANYQFKHALVRDTAYGSLLKERRRSIHAHLLEVLEQEQDISPEVLATHAEAAELTARAVDLWEVASKAAIARPAHEEAISHLEHAIELIEPAAERGDQAAIKQLLSLRIQLGISFLVSRGYQSDNARTAWELALVVADKLGETPMRFTALYGLWVGAYVRAEHAQAAKQAEALVVLSNNNEDDPATVLVAQRLVSLSLLFKGQLTEAVQRLYAALALYDPQIHAGLENRFGQDLGVTTHIYLRIVLMLLGNTREADVHGQEAERAALATRHPNTLCYAHLHLAMFALIQLDDIEAERHCATMMSIALEHRMALYITYGRLLQEVLAAGRGDKDSIARYMLEDAVVLGSKMRLFVPQIRIEACRRALTLGLGKQARELANMAEEMIEETGETMALAELHRLKGALALDAGDRHSAESSLNEAITIAQRQSSKMWELRAAIDLANLWHLSGRTHEAVALLEPMVESMADGDCPQDRATARAMLAELTN